MVSRLTKKTGLVLLAALIVGIPVLCGCGGDGGGAATDIVIGIESDFTGPSASALIEVHWGMLDALDELQAQDPIPGARIKYITYDDKLDYSRAPIGYAWLKGQGAVMMYYSNSYVLDIVVDKMEQDHILGYTNQATPTLMSSDWIFTLAPSYHAEARSLMEWILNTYWPSQQAGRPPKIGYIGFSGMASDTTYRDVYNAMLAESPGSFELVAQSAPMGTTAFATEIQKLQNCDMIVLNIFGGGLASFLKEARNRGYDGPFMGGTVSFLGFWKVVRDAVPLDLLYDCYYIHMGSWWTDPNSFWADLKEKVVEYRPKEADDIFLQGGYGSGWLQTVIYHELAKIAVAEVGPENVDGLALKNALSKLELDVAGYGETWKMHEDGSNILHRMFLMRKYSVADDEWYADSDWFMPTDLGG